MLGMTFLFAKQYPDNLSVNVRRGNRRSLEEGRYVGKPKHGYRLDFDRRLQPDEPYFSMIQKAFEMRLKNKTLDEIADYLNQNGYQQWVGGTAKRKPYHMRRKHVSEIIRDPIYAGVLVYGGEPVDLGRKYDFQPAVSVESFLTINKTAELRGGFKLSKAMRKIGGGSRKADFLRGMVLCGDCGKTMIVGISAKKDKHTREITERRLYFRCETEGCPFRNKDEFKIDLKECDVSIKEKQKSVEALKATREGAHQSLPTYETFLELFRNLAKKLAETTDMQWCDQVIRKIFLNFTVKDKKVAAYSTKPPFSGFVGQGSVLDGRASGT